MVESLTDGAVAAEVSLERKLAAAHKRLLITVVFCCIGWPVFMFGISIFSDYGIGLALLGAVIFSGPIIYRMLDGGLKGAFKLETTVYITKWNGVRVEKDYTDAPLIGIFVNLILPFILLFTGLFVTLSYLLYLIVIYTKLYLRVSEKPLFMSSGFPVIIIGAGVFFAATYVVGML